MEFVIFKSIDSSVPNLEDSSRWRVSGKENITREKTKDRFIIEDLDPLKAPRIESVSDPLINSYFIEENSSNESDSDEESIKLLKENSSKAKTKEGRAQKRYTNKNALEFTLLESSKEGPFGGET